jgi:hypothetical protein
MGALDHPAAAGLDRCGLPTDGDLAGYAPAGQRLPAGLVVIARVRVPPPAAGVALPPPPGCRGCPRWRPAARRLDSEPDLMR